MKNLLFVFTLSFSFLISAQDSISELLEDYNTESIPYIKVENLALNETSTILLDAREIKEYNTSHLKGAIHVGYDEFDISKVTQTVSDKSSKIVVYCSIGIRSEDIAEELKKEGYTNVYNLFGGIFEWKNNDHTIYDNSNQPTENVHTYSEKWSKWLLKGNKIYD
ncbi:rhodanese-like domain-containing protein [Winogradskyella tangerina]|uniref:rhodanese-like domain-containing protein n=1 Tax=Winogradskyella tangerina TaxID=2023240 RepID=UPI000DBE283D|nr:rhodanese-like domain-containing protein [Winogradskyella tangerina]